MYIHPFAGEVVVVLQYSVIKHLAPITLDKVKQKLFEMRVALTRTITAWMTSDNGEGAAADEDAEFGCTARMKASGNNNRSNFVHHNQAYLLYLWEK
jgi:uncharacterized protein involved in outer membrane biogenesis